MNCPRCDGPAATDVLRQYGGVCPKCVLDFAAEQDAPSFPNLEILGLIGEGGMGVVYKARQANLDRIVALKVLSPQLSGDPEFAARFTREARALAQLSHPNIVGIHEFGIHEGVPYLVMEFVEGTSLRKLMAGGKLSAERALEIVPQICDALHYAHGRGVVHRDIKPENVLLDASGRVRIADFGLAKVGRAEMTRMTRSSVMMGTPNYMAPEQIENTLAVDHRADIYSLGVVFYEMLTGELPLGRFKPPSEKAPVDSRLDPVVLKSLEKEPDLRYQSAQEVKEHVSRFDSIPRAFWRKAPAPMLALASLALGLFMGVTHMILFLVVGDSIDGIRFERMFSNGALIAYRIWTFLIALGSVLAGFSALGLMLRGRSSSGAWAAGLGITLSAGLYCIPMIDDVKAFTALVGPLLFLAQGVLQFFIWRAARRRPAVVGVPAAPVAPRPVEKEPSGPIPSGPALQEPASPAVPRGEPQAAPPKPPPWVPVSAYASFTLAIVLGLAHLSFFIANRGLPLDGGPGKAFFGTEGHLAYQAFTIFSFIAASVLGFLALGGMARAKALNGSWAAALGILISVSMLNMPLSKLKVVALVLFPLVFLGAGVALGFAWKARWPGMRVRVYSGLFGLFTSLCCGVASLILNEYGVVAAMLGLAWAAGVCALASLSLLAADVLAGRLRVRLPIRHRWWRLEAFLLVFMVVVVPLGVQFLATRPAGPEPGGVNPTAVIPILVILVLAVMRLLCLCKVTPLLSGILAPIVVAVFLAFFGRVSPPPPSLPTDLPPKPFHSPALEPLK